MLCSVTVPYSFLRGYVCCDQEHLGIPNQVLCPNCNQKRDATKQLHIFRTPQILVLQLKRFNDFPNGKNTTDVNFPHQLQLPRTLLSEHHPPNTRPQHFSLYAVSNHIGGFGGGHYTTHSKQNKNQNVSPWRTFNDADSKPCQPDEVSGPTAYVLFYRKTPD